MKRLLVAFIGLALLDAGVDKDDGKRQAEGDPDTLDEGDSMPLRTGVLLGVAASLLAVGADAEPPPR